jgi:hypothetical protein
VPSWRRPISSKLSWVVGQPHDLNFDKLCQDIPWSWVEQREQLANASRPRTSLVP